MFLSRIALNTSRRQARFLLGSPQAMHAAVLTSFSPGVATETEEGRVLWRIDRQGHATWLYVVSPEAPDMAHIVEQAGWPTQATWETKRYQPFLSRLERGQRWAFRITANPVHVVTKDGVSKRTAHVTIAQQQRWLVERSERSGFAIAAGATSDLQLVVSNREEQTFRRNGALVTIATARYDGLLDVTDAESLRRVLSSGLGRAKGYGCGLMTLAPVPL